MAVVSSYDLGYENLNDTLYLLQKMIETITKLPKWNGHLYNWYNTEDLKPLSPKYVSTVDSGNFVGYLYVLKQFLEEIRMKTVEKQNEKQSKTADNAEQIEMMIMQLENIIENTRFEALYDNENEIFSIGYNV